jgi:hypothetical protein
MTETDNSNSLSYSLTPDSGAGVKSGPDSSASAAGHTLTGTWGTAEYSGENTVDGWAAGGSSTSSHADTVEYINIRNHSSSTYYFTVSANGNIQDVVSADSPGDTANVSSSFKVEYVLGGYEFADQDSMAAPPDDEDDLFVEGPNSEKLMVGGDTYELLEVDLNTQGSAASVPEPSTALWLGAWLSCGLGAALRRRLRRSG